MSMRRVFILPIRFYRFLISPLLGPSCRFYPTCSDYAMQALERHGVFRGLLLGIGRIGRCHPWGGPGGCDPVPERFTWGSLIRYTDTTVKNDKDIAI